MKKSRFKKPYTAAGKTNFPETQGKFGVYIIKKDGIIDYIGYSQYDLYKIMYRHFQDWKNKPSTKFPQKRTTYSKNMRSRITVRVVLTTKLQALRLEKALIVKYKPKNNEIRYEKLNKGEKVQMSKAAASYFGAEVETAPF